MFGDDNGYYDAGGVYHFYDEGKSLDQLKWAEYQSHEQERMAQLLQNYEDLEAAGQLIKDLWNQVMNGGNGYFTYGEDGAQIINMITYNDNEHPYAVAGDPHAVIRPGDGSMLTRAEVAQSGEDYNGPNALDAIKTFGGSVLTYLGNNSIPVSGKTGKATPGTSIASRYLSEKFPMKIKEWKIFDYIPKRILGQPLRSPVLGRTLGRVVPFLGEAFIAWDVLDFGVHFTEAVIFNDAQAQKWLNSQPVFTLAKPGTPFVP